LENAASSLGFSRSAWLPPAFNWTAPVTDNRAQRGILRCFGGGTQICARRGVGGAFR
jgi:hypothetical protein